MPVGIRYGQTDGVRSEVRCVKSVGRNGHRLDAAIVGAAPIHLIGGNGCHSVQIELYRDILAYGIRPFGVIYGHYKGTGGRVAGVIGSHKIIDRGTYREKSAACHSGALGMGYPPGTIVVGGNQIADGGPAIARIIINSNIGRARNGWIFGILDGDIDGAVGGVVCGILDRVGQGSGTDGNVDGAEGIASGKGSTHAWFIG